MGYVTSCDLGSVKVSPEVMFKSR